MIDLQPDETYARAPSHLRMLIKTRDGIGRGVGNVVGAVQRGMAGADALMGRAGLERALPQFRELADHIERGDLEAVAQALRAQDRMPAEQAEQLLLYALNKHPDHPDFYALVDLADRCGYGVPEAVRSHVVTSAQFLTAAQQTRAQMVEKGRDPEDRTHQMLLDYLADHDTALVHELATRLAARANEPVEVSRRSKRIADHVRPPDERRGQTPGECGNCGMDNREEAIFCARCGVHRDAPEPSIDSRRTTVRPTPTSARTR